MKNSKRLVALVSMALTGASSSFGQAWQGECLDPMNTQPYSTDYGTIGISDNIIGVRMGVSGTVTYGGDAGPCYSPARTLAAPGRLAFFAGNTGSVQTDFDNGVGFTTGAPTDPVGDFTYVKILKDGNGNGNSVLYGNGGLRVAYVGASKRYFITAWGDADVDVELQAKVIGDAVRLRWRMRNLKADNQALGMLFGCYAGMFANTPDSTGATQANSALRTATGNRKGFDVDTNRYLGYINMFTGKPVRNERRYDITNPKFPARVDIEFGQSEAYGIRFDNLPGAETPDATSTDLVLIGNHGWFTGPGLLFDNNMRLVVFGDTDNNPNPQEEADIFLNETSILQRFPTAIVAPGASRDVIQYIRAPWSVGDYSDPYAAVLDGPRLIASDAAGVNGLSPNPMTIRAYVDNQYATLDKEVDLRAVRFTVFLPKGLKLVSGETQEKTLDLIQSNRINSVQWRVQADGNIFGDLPYTVTISPTPGPTKTLKGTIRVSATPRLELPAGANLVTIPYSFTDTSMDKILGLKSGEDYVAYKYDPDSSSYIAAISVERGKGYWVIPTSNKGYLALQNATQPSDQADGGLLVTLRQGWNLIGNPYSFSIPMNSLLFVSEDQPADAITWQEAVNNNYIQSSMIQWQRDASLPSGGQYVYTQGASDGLLPHKGYWVYVSTFKSLRLQWPGIFAEGLPNSGRKPNGNWPQNDKQWRLQLSARSTTGIDSQNYVGVVPDKKAAQNGLQRKAPASPGQAIELFIQDEVDGKMTKLSQAVTQRASKKEWDVMVKVADAGDVTLTWPNLPSVPRNMRFKIKDMATGQTHDLRSVSGYTFRANEAGIRKFKLSMEPGGSSRPVIGNVIVSRPTRGAAGFNNPVTVSYALSTDANVTVRVLNSQGKEVYTVTRGRADNAGQNSVTWTLRDNANRTVAAGVYRVEILAETPNGERIRRMVPVNVTR